MKYLNILLFFMLTNILYSQTFSELVHIAIKDNLQLKILEQEYYTALEKAPQVSQLADPELGIGIFPLPVETRVGPQIIRIGATQMLPWKGTLSSKKEVELTKAKALYERIAVFQLELAYQIKKAWLELYEIQRSRAIIEKNLFLLETLERLALSKVESGKTTGADVLRVQLKIEELRQELTILRTSETQPLATINELLNRPLETELFIRDSLSFALIPYQKDTLAARVQTMHPMLQVLAAQQEVSKKVLALNHLDNKPDFGVGLDYIMVNKRGDASPSSNGRDIVQLRGTVRIPLFKQKYEAKEREEQLKIETLEIQKTETINRYRALIEKALSEYKTARLKMDLYHKQKTITQSAINILETAYSAEGNRFDELLQLEKELIDYDLKILKAIVQSHQAKVSVERFSGI